MMERGERWQERDKFITRSSYYATNELAENREGLRAFTT